MAQEQDFLSMFGLGRGLLAGGVADESLSSDGLLGGFMKPRTPREPGILGTSLDDPRTAANLALASGLLRGRFGDGLEGYGKAYQDAEDRQYKRQVGNIGALKSGLELQNLFDTRKRQKAIRDELATLQNPNIGPTQPSLSAPESDDPLGTPTLENFPMLGSPPVAPTQLGSGAEGRFGAASPLGSISARSGALTDNLTNKLIQQAQVYAKHGDYDRSDKIYEQAAKFAPEIKEIRTQMRGDKPVEVIFFKDGRQQVSEYGAAPKTHWMDRGGSLEAVDEYTMQPRGSFTKTMTPGEVASNRVAQANLGVAQGNLRVSQERLALERDSPQYMMTDSGLVALPKRPGGGPIVATPIAGADGGSLRPPLRPIPASANAGIVTNLQNLNRAKDALALVQGGNVGGATGDIEATGLKGYLPNGLVNRMDPAGVDTRAAIADLGSLVIHERSGAAVTAAESPRLMPFIPLATDDRATAEKKLRRFIDVYQQETDALSEIYSREQGYKPNPVLQRGASGSGGNARKSAQGGAVPLPANPSATNLRVGQAYTLPNGKTVEYTGNNKFRER